MRIWGQAEPVDVESGQDISTADVAPNVPPNEKEEGENKFVN